MANIALVGAAGRMGHMVTERAEKMQQVNIVAGVDVVTPAKPLPFPLYPSLDDITEHVDVLMDFSSPTSLDAVLDYCVKHKKPAVLAATGYTPEQKAQIREATVHIPIFLSSNYSIGVCLVQELAKQVAQVRKDADIEVIERHHSGKVDAPSGTALSIADAIASVLPGETEFVYGREGTNAKRKPGEIGIHAVRGGGLVGEHAIEFLSEDEEIDIVHKAYSRKIFADGALGAALSIIGKSPSLYGMPDLLRTLMNVPQPLE